MASHKDILKIKATLCTGDLVERNDNLLVNHERLGQKNGNTPTMDMWQSVARSFGRLDGVMPYILATGNHDYGYNSAENRNTYFNMSHTLTAHFLLCNLYTTTLADNAFVANTFVFTAMALVVLGRTKDALAE